jgi:hypothetical protein
MTQPPDAIDDSRVKEILQHASEIARRQKPAATALDESYESWQTLLKLRRWDDTPETPLKDVQADAKWKSLLQLPAKPLDGNFDLMAAEHFAYARYVALTYGDPHTESVLKTYFMAKKIMPERWLRTSKNHPVLPESKASLSWMSKGVLQGLQDYRNAPGHGGQLGRPFSSREVVTANAPAQYKRAKDTAAQRPY